MTMAMPWGAPGAAATAVVALLILATVVGIVRALRVARLARRDGVRLLLMPLAATLLYLVLFPPSPSQPGPASVTVLTADWQAALADAGLAATTLDAGTTVALPEASGLDEVGAGAVGRHPDLGSALRAHPGALLHVIGSGLTARDEEAARGRLRTFLPVAPATRGFIAIDVPRSLRPGQRITIGGAVHGAGGATVQLVDAGGSLRARARIDTDGHFAVHTDTRDAGAEPLRLDLLDAGGAVVDTADLLLDVHAAPAPRLLLIAGAPNPETRFLRRWAVDAGIVLASRVQLTERVPQRRGDTALTAAALAAHDLVLIDERAFAALAADEHAALLAAVDAGLGLLIRLTADPDPALSRRLAELGFHTRPADLPRRADPAVPARGTDDDAAALDDDALPTRRPLQVDATDAAVLLAADGDPVALWRMHGHGRIGLWWLGETWRLAMHGDATRHGSLWSDAVSTLARAGAASLPMSLQPALPRVGERVIVCDLGGSARAIDPAGLAAPLLTDAHGCAAWWPTRAGLHRLADGRRTEHVIVHAADALPAQAAHARRQRTLHLLEAVAVVDPGEPPPRRGSPWPWFLAWLLATALLIACERPSRVRPVAEATSPAGP